VKLELLAYGVRPEWGSVKAQKEAMKDIFVRCPEKTIVQVCIIIMCLVIMSFLSTYCTTIPVSGKPIHDIDCCLFFTG
jgi:hypothetical protein